MIKKFVTLCGLAAWAVSTQGEEPKSANSTVLIHHTFNKGAGPLDKTPVDGGTFRGSWKSHPAITAGGEINVNGSSDGTQACAYVDLGNAVSCGTPNSVYELEIVLENTSTSGAILTGGFWPGDPGRESSHDASGSPWWYWRSNGEFRASTGPGFSGDIVGGTTEKLPAGEVQTITFVLTLKDKTLSNNSVSLYSGTPATGNLLGTAKFSGELEEHGFPYVGFGARSFGANDNAAGVMKSLTLRQILDPSYRDPAPSKQADTAPAARPDTNAAPAKRQVKMAPAKAERKLQLTGDLLILPVGEPPQADNKSGKADWGSLEVYVDDQLIHRAHAVHPRNVEDAKYWAFLDMKDYKGKEATLRLNGDTMTPEQASTNLSRIESSDKMRHLQPIYKEPGRPQFHFSQIQGWNNDPNGMVYSDGLYHISWQCNPLGNWFGGWYWGHAVSPDLIHWSNCPPTLRPNGGTNLDRERSMAVGNCFSGGAAVDVDNTLGKQEGNQKTIIATCSDTGLGECLAYSTDGGFRYTFMKEFNPITVQPRPQEAKGPGDRSWGRDPKIVWYEPTKSWVLVAYRMGIYPDACSGHMAFYTSKDAKSWEFQSETKKLFPEIYENAPDKGDINKKDFHECPEFLELPVDGNPGNKKWVLLDGFAKYQVGSFDGKKFTPDLEEYRWTICPGTPYAGQCFSNAPDGRAIMMMWSRMGYGDVPFGCGFTLPLELTLRTADDGIRLYANPVKELEQLREKEIFSAQNQKIGGAETVSFDTREQLVEVVASVKTDAKAGSIMLKTGDNTFSYSLDKRQLDGATVHDKDDGRIDFHVFIDRATWEVFAGHGSVYKLGGRPVAAPVGRISVSINGAEGTVESMKVYKLKSFWSENVDTLTYSQKK